MRPPSWMYWRKFPYRVSIHWILQAAVFFFYLDLSTILSFGRGNQHFVLLRFLVFFLMNFIISGAFYLRSTNAWNLVQSKISSFGKKISPLLSSEWLIKPYPKQQILDSSKLKQFADDHFKFNENGRMFSKNVGNFSMSWCFQETFIADE